MFSRFQVDSDDVVQKSASGRSLLIAYKSVSWITSVWPTTGSYLAASTLIPT